VADEEQLRRIGLLTTGVETSTNVCCSVGMAHRHAQVQVSTQSHCKENGMGTNGFARFDYRAMRVMPAACNQEPVLDQQPNQFRLHLTTNALRVVGTPLIKQSMFFPEPK
jgi:hypothetical protein